MKRYEFSPSEQAFLENLPSSLVVFQYVDTHIHTLALSQGLVELYGFKDHNQAYQIMEKDVCYNIHPDDVARVQSVIRKFITESGHFEVIFRGAKVRSHDYRIIHIVGKHVYTPDGARLAYVSYTDEGAYTATIDNQVSDVNRALNNALHEESILKAGYFDSLTGLPNTSSFFASAEKWKETVIRDNRQPALLYIDLKDMKFFNRDHGYSQGDRLLQAFAKLMAATFGSENCCRIGADHFAAYLPEDGLEDTLNSFLSQAAELNEGNSLPVKIGIYRNSTEDVHVSAACDRAMMACKTLSNSLNSCCAYYDDSLRETLLNRKYIISNIDRAIAEKWIKVYYQPIVRAVNGKVCDEEALSRWIDPVKGFMSPADFIPILEGAGLIYKLDLYVLEQVLEKIKTQKAAGFTVVPHSVNLSRSDFDACDIVEEICRRVDGAGVPRDRITIEITESVIGSDFDFMKKQVDRFRSLGFPVWMDDFGSGYSSLDLLQSIKFDLMKFDMSFMRRLHEGEKGKIILAELMKLAASLGVDTVCEGVETEEQSAFLREIGCSKLQGFYYSKPIPFEEIMERYRQNTQIGYENVEEAAYCEVIGRVNLYDLAVFASEDTVFQNAFNTMPIGIIEVKGDSTRFVRSNPSYRAFIKRFLGFDISSIGTNFAKYSDAFMNNVVKTCCEKGIKSFYDEKMPDGSVVHSFARRIAINPVDGTVAVAIAVLSITDADSGATYAGIARALASDYYNIYYIDLDTDKFIEYTSPVGSEGMALERRGERFFDSARSEIAVRVYEKDRASMLNVFTKENILRHLDDNRVFTTTYRLIDSGKPVYVSMKITRMQGGNHIIIGISTIDAQVRQREKLEEIQRERDSFARITALSEDYLSLYSVDPETGNYVEYSTTDYYDALGFEKKGDDFFLQGVIDGKKIICADDLPEFLRLFTKENILREIEQKGVFRLKYRLMIGGKPTPVVLRIARVKERDGEKLIVGVRSSGK